MIADPTDALSLLDRTVRYLKAVDAQVIEVEFSVFVRASSEYIVKVAVVPVRSNVKYLRTRVVPPIPS